MSRRLHRMIVSTVLLLAPVVSAGLAVDVAHADPPKKDPLADALGGQIIFMDRSPPGEVGGPGWFTGHKIAKKDENDEKKWLLHTMVFLKKPLDVNKIDLTFYKISKTGVKEYVEKREQFPGGDNGRSFYFFIKLSNAAPYEPNLKYEVEATVPGGGMVAEGTIELDGKVERIGGGDMDFTKGMDLSKPKEEKPVAPFDGAAAKEALKKIIYEDCKTAASAGGDAKITLTFQATTGKVVTAAFDTDHPPPYSEATQHCISRRFEKAKTKPFTGEASHVVSFHITL